MKYFEVTLTLAPFSEVACDILSAELAEQNFETFVPTEDGLKAYVQQTLFQEQRLTDLIDNFLLPDVSITYRVEDAPDENWNRRWEEEGFEPVFLDDLVCVHDEQHVPDRRCQHDIIINPRMAFGTGTHPTTQQILRQLCQMPMEGLRVVDAGCGTGVLGLLCAQRGASEVFAYDIDEWSVSNTLVNAELNHIYNIKVCEGDASVLPQTSDFDLLIANINRNILLADMPRFARALRPGGRLLLSGFYVEDAEQLVEKGRELGFTLEKQTQQDGWAMLLLTLTGKGNRSRQIS